MENENVLYGAMPTRPEIYQALANYKKDIKALNIDKHLPLYRLIKDETRALRWKLLFSSHSELQGVDMMHIGILVQALKSGTAFNEIVSKLYIGTAEIICKKYGVPF